MGRNLARPRGPVNRRPIDSPSWQRKTACVASCGAKTVHRSFMTSRARPRCVADDRVLRRRCRRTLAGREPGIQPHAVWPLSRCVDVERDSARRAEVAKADAAPAYQRLTKPKSILKEIEHGECSSHGAASYYPSIEKKYGRPMDHWFSILSRLRGMKHMELVAHLKANHGMGHGHANAGVAGLLSRNK